MSDNQKELIIYLLAILLGGSTVGVQYLIQQYLLYSQDLLADIWLTAIYPGYLVVTFLVMRYTNASPVVWAISLMSAFSLLTVKVFGTQAPPFEYILMFLLTLPVIGAGYAAKLLRKRSNSSASAT